MSLPFLKRGYILKHKFENLNLLSIRHNRKGEGYDNAHHKVVFYWYYLRLAQLPFRSLHIFFFGEEGKSSQGPPLALYAGHYIHKANGASPSTQFAFHVKLQTSHNGIQTTDGRKHKHSALLPRVQDTKLLKDFYKRGKCIFFKMFFFFVRNPGFVSFWQF